MTTTAISTGLSLQFSIWITAVLTSATDSTATTAQEIFRILHFTRMLLMEHGDGELVLRTSTTTAF